MSGERERLRATFGAAAADYNAARPGYPAALVDEIIGLAGMSAGGRVLEIGPGAGTLTVRLAERGLRVLGVELSAPMVDVARRMLAAFSAVRFWVGPFEDWPVEPAAFDLVVAADSFHWLDPAVGLDRAAAALRPGGSLALVTNRHVQSVRDDGSFDAAALAVYLRAAPAIAIPGELLPPPWEAPTETARLIQRSGRFGPATIRRFAWEVQYDTVGYLRLLGTFSGHLGLPAAVRADLFAGIAALIEDDFGGSIVRGYQTELFLALRR